MDKIRIRIKNIDVLTDDKKTLSLKVKGNPKDIDDLEKAVYKELNKEK